MEDIIKVINMLKMHRDFEAQTGIIDALEIYKSIIHTPAGAVIEIGSACGGTTIVMILAARKRNKMVYSIDPYPEDFEDKAAEYRTGLMKEFKDKFRLNILNGKYQNIIQINKDIKDCIDSIPRHLSVIFIDGCHEFEFLKREFDLLWPRLVHRGVMYIHDIQCEKGQLTGTEEGGLKNILNYVKGEVISEFMLKLVK
jgi:predicted O-methyltransferase YrrM